MEHLNINQEEFVTLIPLRGGSKGIPRKNLKNLCGKPLFTYVVEASINSGLKTFISSEDNEIKEICKNLFKDLIIINRPNEIARDTSSTEEVIEHFLEVEKKCQHIILLQATSPLTTNDDINNAIKQYILNHKRPLISVVTEHSFIWDNNGKPLNYNPFKRPRRQDWDGINKENGAIYIFSRDHFKKHKCRANKQVTLFRMQNKTKYEIDELEDFKILSAILKQRKNNGN
tara:strand:- start:93 stop:782 length:690 start_codon:yes stop_codon:yes gene_type:complete